MIRVKIEVEPSDDQDITEYVQLKKDLEAIVQQPIQMLLVCDVP